MKKILLSLTFVALMCSAVILAAALSPQTPPVTQLLTDHDLSTYDAMRPEAALSPSGLQVVWSEHGFINANGSDMDLFYGSLPGNNTQRIRHADAVTNGQGYTQLGTRRIAVGSNGQVYLAWVEPTATHGNDVFFWKTGMTTPQNLSNHTLTGAGGAEYLFLTLDNNNIPHALWAESAPTHTSVFYWKEGASTIELSVVTPPVAHFNITRALDLISHNGIIHAFWRDLNPATGWALYYWNSHTQTAVDIRLGQPALSDPPLYERAFVSPNGTFHATWHERYSSQSSSTMHWDSNTATCHTILTAEDPISQPVLGSDGHLHVFNYVTNGPLSHWHSQNLNNQQLTPNLGSGFPFPVFIAGKGAVPVHAVWQDSDPNWPGHLSDLFYWRPGLAQPQNISDHSQTPANIPNYIALAAANDGSVHIAWEEGVPTYYHSGSNSTTSLNASLTAHYDSLGITSQSDDPYLGYQGSIFRVYNNVAYWFLASTNSNTATPYSLWRSDNNSYTLIPAVYGTDNPTGHGARFMWFDRLGQPQLAWRTPVTNEGTNLHYWNSADGSVDVSDTQNTSGSVGLYYGIIGATSLSNQVYLVWLEESGSAEGLDVYGAVRYAPFTNPVFLPFVRR
jgi:hypothetical protein